MRPKVTVLSIPANTGVKWFECGVDASDEGLTYLRKYQDWLSEELRRSFCVRLGEANNGATRAVLTDAVQKFLDTLLEPEQQEEEKEVEIAPAQLLKGEISEMQGV